MACEASDLSEAMCKHFVPSVLKYCPNTNSVVKKNLSLDFNVGLNLTSDFVVINYFCCKLLVYRLNEGQILEKFFLLFSDTAWSKQRK